MYIKTLKRQLSLITYYKRDMIYIEKNLMNITLHDGKLHNNQCFSKSNGLQVFNCIFMFQQVSP